MNSAPRRLDPLPEAPYHQRPSPAPSAPAAAGGAPAGATTAGGAAPAGRGTSGGSCSSSGSGGGSCSSGASCSSSCNNNNSTVWSPTTAARGVSISSPSRSGAQQQHGAGLGLLPSPSPYLTRQHSLPLGFERRAAYGGSSGVGSSGSGTQSGATSPRTNAVAVAHQRIAEILMQQQQQEEDLQVSQAASASSNPNSGSSGRIRRRPSSSSPSGGGFASSASSGNSSSSGSLCGGFLPPTGVGRSASVGERPPASSSSFSSSTCAGQPQGAPSGAAGAPQAAGISPRIYASRPHAPPSLGAGGAAGGGSGSSNNSSSSSLSSMGGPGAPSPLSLLKSPPPALARSISYGGESSIDQVVRSGHHGHQHHNHHGGHHPFPHHHAAHGAYQHQHQHRHAHLQQHNAGSGGSPRLRRTNPNSAAASPSSSSGLVSPLLPVPPAGALAGSGVNSPGERERGRAFFPEDDRPSPRTIFYGAAHGGGSVSGSGNSGGSNGGAAVGHVISPSAQSEASGHTSSVASSLSASTTAALSSGGGGGGPSPRLPAPPDTAATPSPRNPFGYDSSSSTSNQGVPAGGNGVASPPHAPQHPYMGVRSPMVHTREMAMAQLVSGQGSFLSNSSACSSGDEAEVGAAPASAASAASAAAGSAGNGAGASGGGTSVSALLTRRARSNSGAATIRGIGQLVAPGGAGSGAAEESAAATAPGWTGDGLLQSFLRKKKASSSKGSGSGDSNSNPVATALKSGMKDAARKHNDRVLAQRLEEAKFGSSGAGQFPRSSSSGSSSNPAAGPATGDAAGAAKPAGASGFSLPSYEFGLWKGSSGGGGSGSATPPIHGMLLKSGRCSEARFRRRKTMGDEADVLSVPSEGEDPCGSSTGGASSLESSQESVVDVSVLVGLSSAAEEAERAGGSAGSSSSSQQFQPFRGLSAPERQRMLAAAATGSGHSCESSVDQLERGARQLSPHKALGARRVGEEKGAEAGPEDEGDLMEAGVLQSQQSQSQLQAAASSETIEWKKGAQIGKGTFGSVFVGLNARTGERFAVKEIGLVDGSRAEVARLEKEIVLMKRLHHPHIVRYLGTAHDPHHLYIFMEYVPGGSIASMLAQYGAFGEPLLRRLVAQVVLGIEYLHAKGIVHRDIKGANVLVTNDGVAKLADFGCSRQLQGLQSGSLENSLKTITGSVPWMAPEVIKQSGRFPKAADIWSIGATVIEMKTGRHPWPEFSNQLAALFHVATATDPPALPETLSPEGKDFLRRCLVIDEGARATAAELLRHPFIRGEVEAEGATGAVAAAGKEELAASLAALSIERR